MQKHKHIGSNFDDFLEEEGILEECKEEAAKRVLVWQLEQKMYWGGHIKDFSILLEEI
jgi:hypothetical protein